MSSEYKPTSNYEIKAQAPEANSNDAVIRVRNLSKCYQIYDTPRDRLKQFVLPRLQSIIGKKRRQYFRDFWALKDVSFEIKRGETVGIIGRNGSGKSTLLQMICGTLSPTSGSIETTGRIAALLELGSGFNPEFTGRENVYMNAAVFGLSKEQTDARFEDIVAFAEIGDFIEQPVKTYSSGMMVRLAFAVIAHVDADILVIDEALAVGDAFFTQKCMRFLHKFMQSGTAFFVSHDTNAVKSLCEKAIWVERGELLQHGSSKDVCEFYLEAFYEQQQGKSSTTKLKKIIRAEDTRPTKDQRLDYINHSNLRNDLQIFKFDPNAASFGKRGAQITNAELLDIHGSRLNWIVGGEPVTLSIEAIATDELRASIIGFVVKDRLGQELFGDNTFLSYKDNPQTLAPGNHIFAEFKFLMPTLPPGDYSVNVAIADGTQNEHIQHHWIHDAVLFKSESSSVSTGLIGIPMHDITLKIVS